MGLLLLLLVVVVVVVVMSSHQLLLLLLPLCSWVCWPTDLRSSPVTAVAAATQRLLLQIQLLQCDLRQAVRWRDDI